MTRFLLLSIALLTSTTVILSQSVGIGTQNPDSSAILDLSSWRFVHR